MRLGIASALVAAALTASAQSTSVQGRVISSVHGEPVAHVIVTLRELPGSGADQPQVYVCETGADGRFSIANMQPGLYDPQPSKQGYETHPPNRFATPHDYPPVKVEGGKPVTDLELRMIPDSVIAGRVLDADGDPVRYAQVELQQYGYAAGEKQLRTMRQAQTNDRGEYRLFYIPAGRYYLRAEATMRSARSGMMRGSEQVRGTLPPTAVSAAYYPGVADASRATELQAQPGAELDGIDLSLAPEKLYSIRGKFPATDPTKARRGVRVIERVETDKRPLYSIRMMNDSYEIMNIALGSYFVYGDTTNPANPDERQYARQPVEVIDRDVDGVDLVFSPGVRVTGTVKVDGSAPVPMESLQVYLQPAGSQGRDQAKVAADGKFASVEIEPGIYQFGVAGRNAYLKSVRVGGQEAAGGKIDTERLSGPVTLVVSADFGRVQGTVTDEDGKPVYNANVTLIPDQSLSDWHDRFRNSVTSATGRVAFSNVEPGEYKVFAWVGAEPGAPQSAEFRKPYEDRGVSVKVEANGTQSLDLKPIVLAPER